MSKNQISLSLDFHQWGVVIGSDLDRLGNFIRNYTMESATFGPVDARVVAEFHDHLDKMKVMTTAWAAAYQKQAVQSPSSSSTKTPPDPAPTFSTSWNGDVAPKVKKKPGRPKKIDVDKRARLAPNRIAS